MSFDFPRSAAEYECKTPFPLRGADATFDAATAAAWENLHPGSAATRMDVRAALVAARPILTARDDTTRPGASDIPAPRIDASAITWKEVGDEPEEGRPEFGDKASRLNAHVVIAGLSMHLDAYEVNDAGPGEDQVAKQDDPHLGEYHSAAGADGPFETTELPQYPGRVYVLVATPFC